MSDLSARPTPTVLCHATGFCGAVLAPVAARLDAGPFALPDLRGHGLNQAPPSDDLSWRHWATDALNAVDQITTEAERQSEAVYGFGHSGGGAALIIAEQQRPGTFRALFLYEPVVFTPETTALMSENSNPLSESSLRRRPDFPSRAAAYENFAGKPPMNTFDPEALHAYIDHGFEERPDGSVTLRCRPEVESRLYQMGPLSGAWDGLDAVTCPVVVACGAPGTGAPAAFAEPLVAALSDAELLHFDHLGHFGPMEDPAGIAVAFQALIDRTRS